MIQRFDHFMSGPPTARKSGSKQSPVLAGLREKAKQLLANLGAETDFTADTSANPENPPMLSSTNSDHHSTALALHARACPSIDATKPLDGATTREAERAWTKFHAGHKAEVVALGLGKVEDFNAFMRAELSEIAR